MELHYLGLWNFNKSKGSECIIGAKTLRVFVNPNLTNYQVQAFLALFSYRLLEIHALKRKGEPESSRPTN